MARRDAPSLPQRALVAAAKRVSLGDKQAAAELGKRQEWQAEAWAMWRVVPEVKQAMLFLGAQLSKLRLYIAVMNPEDPDGEPIPATDEAAAIDPQLAAAAEAELRRLQTYSVGGIPELLRKLMLHYEVPGEGFLVGYGARAAGEEDPRPGKKRGTLLEEPLPEEWNMRSTSEVETKGDQWIIKASPGDQHGRKIDKNLDTVIRLWLADPEWGEQADSSMQGVLGECRLLQALTNQQAAVANSQMHAGIITLPNELGLNPMPRDPEDDSDDPTMDDPFEDELDRSFTEPIEMPDALGTIRPMLVRGPGEYLKPEYFRHIKLGRDLDSTIDARIDQRVRRIARGLNMPVEVLEGHMATTFSNAEQIDQDLFDDHVQPRCYQAVTGLTQGYLRPNLLDPDEGGPVFDPEQVARLLVWYDPAALVRQPDVEGNAGEAHDKNTISDASYRRAKGFSEDDAPDALELIIRNGLKRGILTAELTGALLQSLAEDAGIDWPDFHDLAPGTGMAPNAEAAVLLQALSLREALNAQPGNGDRRALTAARRENPGAALVAIDQSLRTRLLVAASAAMDRAIEQAGNRLRGRLPSAERPQLSGLRPRTFAQHLGPARVAQLAEDPAGLFTDDTWQELEAQFMEWGAAAQQEATQVVYKIVAGFTESERGTLKLRQAEDLSEAWGWLESTLRSLAVGRLMDPDPAAPPIGEFDPTLRVPTGIIRQAMARAGGAASLTATGQGGAYITLTDAGTRPAGGIATGDRLRDTLRDHGAQIEAYQWVYGPAQRRNPFEPHLQLDGLVFRNFDDPALANTSGWPELDYFLPGDHSGCLCDTLPIILGPDELT